MNIAALSKNRSRKGIARKVAFALFLLLIGNLAMAATLSFEGRVVTIVSDQGGAIYSGTEVDDPFEGALNDGTFDGFISDLETSVSLQCCIRFPNGLAVRNDAVLGAPEAALLSTLTGQNYSAGDLIDLVNIEGRAVTPGGGVLQVELVLVFAPSQFSDDSLSNYPVDQNDILVTLAFAREFDSQDSTIYEAVGLVEQLTIIADTFSINAGLNDAWVNADAPLQGMFFTVFPNLQLAFLAWFTFDSEPPPGGEAVFGADDQRWVTGLGALSGANVLLSVELTSGGIFNGSDPMAVQQPGYGVIRIGFRDCAEAVLYYDFPSIGRSGYMEIARVLPDGIALCQALTEP